MHIFISLYLIGLLLGVVFYGITYYFSNKYTYKKRSAIIAVVGGIILIGSLAVGGFEGMPFGMLSLGVFTVAVVLLVFGENPLFKKIAITCTVLFAVSMFALAYINETDYWIIKKENEYTSQENEIYKYLNKLQTETSIRGFKIMDTVDSNAVVLSLGEDRTGNSIEVRDVEELNGKTIIYVRSFYNKSIEKNPTVIIGIDRLRTEVEIRDVDGTMYQKIKK